MYSAYKFSGRSSLAVFVLFLIIPTFVFAEHPDSAYKQIQERLPIFKNAAVLMDVDCTTLCAIIYTERLLNYDWKDPALDVLFAQSGWNSSIGLCQVKLKTAYWIEVQLNDSSSMFYPGDKYRSVLKQCLKPGELIKKLSYDSLNVIYAAAYLRIASSYWEKNGFPIHDRPEILGTLYSTGLFLRDGSVRKPHKKPVANMFGNMALQCLEKFYDD